MLKRFILCVPQFSALLIRCIYQLLLNKLLTINEDVLYLNRRCCLMTQIRTAILSQRKRSTCRICFNAFLGRSQIRTIRRTIVKTTVCQNGGASLLLIDKNVWPTEKQQAWAHFYCWRLLAISERRHIYFRSYPNGHKWNKFLHLVVLTFRGGLLWGFLFSFFLDDKTWAPAVFNSFSFFPRTHFETSLVMVSYYGYEIWCH